MKIDRSLLNITILFAVAAICLPAMGIADTTAPQTTIRAYSDAPSLPELPMPTALMPEQAPAYVDLPNGTGINDGSFENGPAPASAWTESASNPGSLPRIIDAVTVTGEATQDGTYCWWGASLSGGFANVAYQDITIPDSANSIKFHHSIYRPVADDGDADFFSVVINGTPVYTKPLIQMYAAWPTFTMDYLDVSDYQGQTITLTLYGIASGSTGGSVLVDNITTDDTLVQQPIHDAFNAIVSQDYESANDSLDIYLAEDFELDEQRNITTLWIPGGILGASDLSSARSINVAIFADAGGVPDGYPNDGITTPLWSLSVPYGDSQLETTSDLSGSVGDIKLTLDSPVTLDAGIYWITTWLDMDFAVRWYWAVSNATHGSDAVLINPGDGWALGATTWTSLNTTHGYTGLAAAIEHEAVSSTPAPPPGGGGGGGGCFITTIK